MLSEFKKKKDAKRVYVISVKESRHYSLRSGHGVHKCCKTSS